MIGITSREILATKDINPGKIKIDTDQAGLYPSSASLVAINGRTMAEMAKDHSLSNFGKDLDKGCMHSNPSTYAKDTQRDNLSIRPLCNDHGGRTEDVFHRLERIVHVLTFLFFCCSETSWLGNLSN